MTNASRSPFADFGHEHRAKSVPSEADGFVADLDATFLQQALDVSQRKREPDIRRRGQIHSGKEYFFDLYNSDQF